jgi:hypothetical protein
MFSRPKQTVLEKDFSISSEPPRTLIRDIRLATNNGFGRNTVPNWGCTDHGNATKHRNQTEVRSTHSSVAVVGRIIKGFNGEDGTGTYETLGRTLYSRVEKRELGRCAD